MSENISPVNKTDDLIFEIPKNVQITEYCQDEIMEIRNKIEKVREMLQNVSLELMFSGNNKKSVRVVRMKKKLLTKYQEKLEELKGKLESATLFLGCHDE